MASHRAVITGIAGLKFISRKPAEDLLNVISHFDNCKFLAEWFASIGYLYCGSTRPSESFYEDFEFVRRGTDEDAPAELELPSERTWDFQRNGQLIKLTASYTSPIADILKHSHFTLFMNIVTHNHAYCLFPRSTLIQKKSFRCRPRISYGDTLDIRLDVQYRRDCFGKHTAALPDVEDACNLKGECSFRVQRSVGDRWCLCIAASGNEEVEQIPDYSECNSWAVRYGADWMTMAFRMLKVPGAKFQYCVHSELLFPLRRNLELNLATLDAEIARATELEQSSGVSPPSASSVDNIITALMAERRSKAEKMGYTKPRPKHDVLDAYTTFQIFYLLREVERRYKRILLQDHYYYRNAFGIERLTIIVHILLEKKQKPNYLMHWHHVLDRLEEEHIDLQFQWR
ncbi:hypothetical protein GYMLUDRAFT_52649 [Collybiopsis luxurians FD-317 M1]|nr:hypothetical protein GYMLUDRAFT_52649 [Collybiopsis luxurians FD-317 M1]